MPFQKNPRVDPGEGDRNDLLDFITEVVSGQSPWDQLHDERDFRLA